MDNETVLEFTDPPVSFDIGDSCFRPTPWPLKLITLHRDKLRDRWAIFSAIPYTMHYLKEFIQFTENTITFLGEKIPNVPVFRLTYLRNEKDSVTVRFEMSRDGVTFMTYTEGRCKRKIN